MAMKKVHNIRFYNIEPRAIHCFALEVKSKKLALSRSDGSIEVWDLSHTPHIERTIPTRVNYSVEALTWCGERLFSAGLQGTVVEYDLKTLSIKIDVPATAGPCWCLASNRSKTHLAAGTEDGYINIFNVIDGLQFEKFLDRQEGRVLCIAWDATGDKIVTGSVDAVRIWDVKTGHAVHRMIPSRAEKNLETIVWCLAVTEDFTIVSGDSRGRLTFWDGITGTQVESFLTHKADVLCLCMSEDESSVYCAGVDPLIMSFSRVELKSSGSVRTKWVKSVQRRIHEHDVRALAIFDDKLFSAGVDSYLAISSYPRRKLVKYPPIFQTPCVTVCQQARYLLLRYTTYLEVWQLGNAAEQESHNEGSLPLVKSQVQLLTLKSQGGDTIVCADMSSNGEWLAYSTLTTLKFFRFQIMNGSPKLRKLMVSFEISSAHRMKFMPDNSQVVIATSTGEIAVVQLNEEILTVEHVSHAVEEKLLKDAVHLLTVSPDGKFIVAADHESNIVVWTREKFKFHCKLPSFTCAPTALAVHPSTNVLVVVYSDHKVIEFCLQELKFTSFSRGLVEQTPMQWLTRGFAVNNVTFDQDNENIILLQDDSSILVIDKNKELPNKQSKIPRIGSPYSTSDSMDGSQSFTSTSSLQHAFHVIKKYKHLIHLESLSNDELVAVEASPLSLVEKLSAALKQKRFGGM